MNRYATLAILLTWTLSVSAEVTVGVWNIENLSPTAKRGFPELQGPRSLDPRTNQQLKKIADHIKDDLKASAMMLTEIHGDRTSGGVKRSSQLDVIVNELGPSWKYWLGQTGGKQSIAFLYDENDVELLRAWELKVPDVEVQGSDIYDRDPLVVHVRFKPNLNDILMVGLHLKSVQTNVHNHMAAAAKLIGVLADSKGRDNHGLPKVGKEHEVIVMGDLNDSSHKRRGFKFLFDYFEGIGYDHLGNPRRYPDTRVNGSEIDHIFVSKNLKAEVVRGSFKVHTVPENDTARNAYRKDFSDHFPLTVRLETHADTDG